jgi:hypothetical protein
MLFIITLSVIMFALLLVIQSDRTPKFVKASIYGLVLVSGVLLVACNKKDQLVNDGTVNAEFEVSIGFEEAETTNYLMVQVSEDGKNFVDKKKLAPNVSSTTVQVSTKAPNLFFRTAAYDVSGEITYTPIATVRIKENQIK